MYDAKIHPEQYSDTLREDQIAQLHKSILYVCKFAVENLADSSIFPEEWLFKHRWGKGKKDSTTTLPNGKKFVFITVGGRTSCVVPSVQKKTGPAAGDVKAETAVGTGETDEQAEAKPKREGKKSSAKGTDKVKVEEGEESTETKSKPSRGKKRAAKEDDASPAVNGEVAEGKTKKPASKKRKTTGKTNNANAKDGDLGVDDHTPDEVVEKRASEQKRSKGKTREQEAEPKTKGVEREVVENSGRRRSGRVSGKGV